MLFLGGGRGSRRGGGENWRRSGGGKRLLEQIAAEVAAERGGEGFEEMDGTVSF